MAFADWIKWGNAPAQPQQQAPVTTQQPNNSQAPAPQNPNPTPQQGTPQNPQPTPPALDKYTELLTPKPQVGADGKPVPQQQQHPTGLLPWDDKSVNDTVSQADFTSGIPNELYGKALQGDVEALKEIINQSNRAAFQQALKASHGMVELGGLSLEQRIGQSFDSRVKDVQLRSQNADNPALQHPIGQALHQMVKKQMLTANPNLSPEQINQQSVAMFNDFAQMFIAPSQQKQKEADAASKPKEQDWQAWFDTPTQS